MTRDEVLAQITEIGVVPVIRAPTTELAVRAVEAVVAGGIPIIEITLTVPGALTLIESLSIRFGKQAVIGAGTVLSETDGLRSVDAGARFVVSPGLDLDLIRAVRERNVAMLAGALTPTEVISAWRARADLVKVFPCSALGGAKYVKALKGPLPEVKLLPTGGVNVDTAADFIRAGASALGVGSELVDLKALEAGNAAPVTDYARRLRSSVREARAALT